MPINLFSQQLQKIDDFSTFLALISLILSIQSTQLDRQNTNQKTNKQVQSQSQSDRIITISVFIAACSNFLDLSTAKATYDRLLEQKDKVTQRQLDAARDLLTSRVFSTMAAIYLIRATIKSRGFVEELATPTGIGGVT